MFVFIAVLFGMELISLGDSQQYIVTVDATIYKGEYNGISDQWNFYRTNQSVKKGTIIAEGKIYKKVNSFVREARKEDKGNIPVESHEMMYCENTSGCVKTEVLRIIPKETNSNRLWHEIMIKYYKDELDSISDSDRQKYISELDKHINLYYMNPATNFKLEDGFSHPDYELMRTIKSKIQVSSGEVETTGEYEKMKKFTAQEIKNYINHHDKIDDLPQEVLDAWQNTIEAEPNMEQKDKEDLLYKIENKTVLDSGHTNDLIYNAPNLDNTNYTDHEKEGKFELKYIALDDVEKVIEENAKEYGDKHGIAREMLDLFQIYKNEK